MDKEKTQINFTIFYENYNNVLVRKRACKEYKSFLESPLRFPYFSALVHYEGTLVNLLFF